MEMKEEIRRMIERGEIDEIVKRGLDDSKFASAAASELLAHKKGPDLLAKILTRLG